MFSMIGEQHVRFLYEAMETTIAHMHVAALQEMVACQDDDDGDWAREYGEMFANAEIQFSVKDRNMAWLDVRMNMGRQRTPDAAMSFSGMHGTNISQNAAAIAFDLFPMIAASVAFPTKGAARSARHSRGHWRWSQLLHPLVVQDIIKRNEKVSEQEARMDTHLEQNTLSFGFAGMDGGEDGLLIAQGIPAIRKLPNASRKPTRLVMPDNMKDLATPGSKLVDVMELETCGTPHVDEAVKQLTVERVEKCDYGTAIVLAPAYHIGLDPYPNEKAAMLMRGLGGLR